MSALLHIGWAVWLLLSIALVFKMVGMRLMVNFFPEGQRWWQFPAQLASLGFFAAAVLNHPFSI